MPNEEQKVAHIIVESLYKAGVKVVFGIPGAKVDAIFDTLSDHPEIKLVVCRHEQNAAFMAAAMGRITGTPGVCVATSGPGAGNLTTGLVTATTEGDPVVAIVGSVPRHLNGKHTHQSMPALEILTPGSKSGFSIDVEDRAAEVVINAFRTANSAPKGAAVISIPMDVASGKSTVGTFDPSAYQAPKFGPAPSTDLQKAASMIDNAKLPVLFLGMRASSPIVIGAVRDFMRKHRIAVVETFQAAGAVPEDLAATLFYGRVGIFRNQTGDRLLANSDLILTLGYDPTEYDASSWNPTGNLPIIHLDYQSCSYDASYRPSLELLGSLKENILALQNLVTHTTDPSSNPLCRTLLHELKAWQTDLSTPQPDPSKTTPPPPQQRAINPLHFISTLQTLIPPSTTVTVDVGTVYIYMMRYFLCYEPRKLLCSNGQQTLGIGMPWAIAASLAQQPACSRKVVSLSGDGGFMFSVQELSTAVQQRCNLTHFVWNDEAFNMVEFQEEMKYGRSSGIGLGGIDFVKLVEAFGGKGWRVSSQAELEGVMREALEWDGVGLVDVRIDYSRVKELAGNLVKDSVG